MIGCNHPQTCLAPKGRPWLGCWINPTDLRDTDCIDCLCNDCEKATCKPVVRKEVS